MKVALDYPVRSSVITAITETEVRLMQCEKDSTSLAFSEDEGRDHEARDEGSF